GELTERQALVAVWKRRVLTSPVATFDLVVCFATTGVRPLRSCRQIAQSKTAKALPGRGLNRPHPSVSHFLRLLFHSHIGRFNSNSIRKQTLLLL
ncbi:hypothetical protein, partial [Deinococcus ruber]|uniref:hypothetical protein n=1 Tax=Deinococcus ruber TaxID=1848197 RepID=UPI001E5C0900